MTGIIWAIAVAQCISPVAHNASIRETVAISCAEGTMRVYKYEPPATPVALNKEVKPQKQKVIKKHTIKRKPGKRQTTQRKYRRKRAKLY